MADVWIFSHDCPIEDIILQPGETCDARWENADAIRAMMASGDFINDTYFDELVTQMSNEISMENSRKLSGLKILCISGSNRINATETNSYRKCKAVIDEAGKYIPDMQSEIIEMQNYALNPCIACSKCLNSKRCAIDDAFNHIYNKIIGCDILFIVSPHYAPIPAKLCMLFEKMGQVVSIRSSKDKLYRGETYGIRTALITHGATAVNEDAQKRKKRILNDPIAVGLHDSQLNIMPFDDEWNTGICVQPIEINTDGKTVLKINEYVRKVVFSI